MARTAKQMAKIALKNIVWVGECEELWRALESLRERDAREQRSEEELIGEVSKFTPPLFYTSPPVWSEQATLG